MTSEREIHTRALLDQIFATLFGWLTEANSISPTLAQYINLFPFPLTRKQVSTKKHHGELEVRSTESGSQKMEPRDGSGSEDQTCGRWREGTRL